MGREPLVALALAAAALAACKRERERAPPPPATPPNAPQVPPPLAGASFYRLDAGPQTPCTAGTPCEARIVLTALGGYKINRDYPFKLIADPAPGVAVDGTGTFAFDDARSGTLTLPFRASASGAVELAGTFKLSVCTDEECEIAEPKIRFQRLVQ